MMLDNAWRARRQCVVAWMDFFNAFGSVAHCHIFNTLQELRIPDRTIDLVQELYDGCTITIQSLEGKMHDIPIQSGVQQGCLFSPIIFNLEMEPFL